MASLQQKWPGMDLQNIPWKCHTFELKYNTQSINCHMISVHCGVEFCDEWFEWDNCFNLEVNCQSNVFLSKIVVPYLITIHSNQRNMLYDQDLRISMGASIQLKSGWWASWSVSSLMVYIHDTAIWAVSERSLVDGRSSKHLCALNLDCTISRQMEYQGQH